MNLLIFLIATDISMFERRKDDRGSNMVDFGQNRERHYLILISFSYPDPSHQRTFPLHFHPKINGQIFGELSNWSPSRWENYRHILFILQFGRKSHLNMSTGKWMAWSWIGRWTIHKLCWNERIVMWEEKKDIKTIGKMRCVNWKFFLILMLLYQWRLYIEYAISLLHVLECMS